MNETTMNELKNRIQNYIKYDSTVRISSFNINIDIQIKKENKKISITIPIKYNWEEIINRIDIQLHNVLLSECPICLKQENRVYIVSCNKCANKWCNLCYVDMIRINIDNVNYESISCPFCRFSFSGEIPTYILNNE